MGAPMTYEETRALLMSVSDYPGVTSVHKDRYINIGYKDLLIEAEGDRYGFLFLGMVNSSLSDYYTTMTHINPSRKLVEVVCEIFREKASK